MAGIAENQLDGDFQEVAPSTDPQGSEGKAPGAKTDAPAVNPLLKILQMILGTKSNAAPSAAAAKGEAANAVPGAAPPSMPSGPLMTVLTRNEFYRDGFRRLLMIAGVQLVIILALLLALMTIVISGRSEDRYFATTADGRIMQLTPLDQPGNMTTAALMSWVALATSEIMTFGYHDYQRRLQASSRHFTRHGWETFTGALQSSRIIDAMLANKEVLTAAPHSAPVLEQEGVINGRYRWIVKLKMQVSYDGAGTSRKNNLVVKLVIDRVPSLENPSGVGIEQWISTEG